MTDQQRQKSTAWRRMTEKVFGRWHRQHEDRLDDLRHRKQLLEAFRAGASWIADPRFEEILERLERASGRTPS